MEGVPPPAAARLSAPFSREWPVEFDRLSLRRPSGVIAASPAASSDTIELAWYPLGLNSPPPSLGPPPPRDRTLLSSPSRADTDAPRLEPPHRNDTDHLSELTKLRRHSGHVVCDSNHMSMQLGWNTCLHLGSCRRFSHPSKSVRHTTHSLHPFFFTAAYETMGKLSTRDRSRPSCCAADAARPSRRPGRELPRREKSSSLAHRRM